MQLYSLDLQIVSMLRFAQQILNNSQMLTNEFINRLKYLQIHV